MFRLWCNGLFPRVYSETLIISAGFPYLQIGDAYEMDSHVFVFRQTRIFTLNSESSTPKGLVIMHLIWTYKENALYY
jgi:hypothetical protein